MPLLDAWSVLKQFNVGQFLEQQGGTPQAFTPPTPQPTTPQPFTAPTPPQESVVGVHKKPIIGQTKTGVTGGAVTGNVGVAGNNTAMLAQAYRDRQNNLAAEQQQTNQMMAAPNQQYQMMQMANQSIHDRMSGR